MEPQRQALTVSRRVFVWHQAGWRVAVPLAATLLGACDAERSHPNAPVSPGLEHKSAGSALQGDIIEPPVLPRFDLRLEVLAQPRLNVAIPVSVTLTANVATEQARIVLRAPELEVAKLMNGRLIELPPGSEITPVFDHILAIGAGQQLRLTGSISIPMAGYFRLAAVARPAGQTARRSPVEPLQDVITGEIWIYVDENRGAVSAEFDGGILPDTVVAAPGPRQIKRESPPSGVTGPGTSAPPNAGAAPRAMQAWGPPHLGRLVFWDENTDPANLRPAVGAKVSGTYWYYDGQSYTWMMSLQVYTDQQGYFEVPCNYDWLFDGLVALDNDSLIVTPGGTIGLWFEQCPGGPRVDYVVPSARAGRLWANTLATIRSSATRFDHSRPRIDVRVENPDGNPNRAAYYRSEDRIRVGENRIWFQDGFFVAAHEYGHAFHERAIGGIGTASGQCPPAGHWLNGAYNLQCAYTEGFADFYAAFVLQDSIVGFREDLFEFPHDTAYGRWGSYLPYGRWCLQSTSYNFCSSGQFTGKGSLAEAAVAAFLYDLADGSGTANYPPGWDDDGVAVGAAWIGYVINSCEVLENGQWVRNNGVDHLAYCFEQRLGDASGSYRQQGYFSTRYGSPSGWRTPGAPAPPVGAEAIKLLWQGNLYPHGPFDPPPPLNVSIGGPSEIQPGSWCHWWASVYGGQEPYTYQWSGVLSGTSSEVYGAPGTGWLYLTVTSADGQGDGAQLYITESWSAPSCGF